MPDSGDDSSGDVAAATRPRSSPGRPRAGARALSILAVPLNVQILQVLADRPMRLSQLRKATGLPAQTTLRGHLCKLGEAGVLTKRPTRQMPYAVENELTAMGIELLEVAERLASWLAQAPDGPIALESGAARGAVRALIDGWESKMMRALAAHPLSLTELDSLIADRSYPALERRLSSMRLAGLVEAQQSSRSGTPYGVTEWARRGVAPLVAASHCEVVHTGRDGTPVTPIDIEAAFLLATPLVGLPREVAGSCQLEVERNPRFVPRPVGVQVTIEAGRIVSCVSGLDRDPAAYAAGSVAKWFSAVQLGKTGRLRFGGSRQIAEGVVDGLHATLG